jgi:hypothetical protein
LAQFPDSGDLLDWSIKYFKKNRIDQFLNDASPLLSDAQKMTILVNLADSLTSDGDADPSEQELFINSFPLGIYPLIVSAHSLK